jgi:hypothetical protein
MPCVVDTLGTRNLCLTWHCSIEFCNVTNSLRLRFEVCIGVFGIELMSTSNLSWYCIGPQFEFSCLDDCALPFGILVTNPIPFPICMHRRDGIEFWSPISIHSPHQGEPPLMEGGWEGWRARWRMESVEQFCRALQFLVAKCNGRIARRCHEVTPSSIQNIMFSFYIRFIVKQSYAL